MTFGGSVLRSGRVKPASGGNLLEREHALSTQAAESILETVLHAELVDDGDAEPVRHTGPQASGVQDVGDLGICVMVEQAINFGDHRRMRLSQLSS
jgi:hypothetical protein